MAMHFEAELRAFLQHKLEQNKQMHEALTTGRVEISATEAVPFLADMLVIYSEAFGRVARQIDELRAAVDGGKL